jgi:phage terminase small subunit
MAKKKNILDAGLVIRPKKKPTAKKYNKQNPDELRGRKRVNENSPLTRMQEIFVKELVSNDGTITATEAALRAGYSEKSAPVRASQGTITATEAALRAGYSEKSAPVRASQMTNPYISPHVCKMIKEYKDELDAKFGVTYQRHVRDLQRIRDLAMENGAYSAAVQAEYRRGMAQGDIYVSKSEIRHGSIDSMSKDEVLKALNELKNTYGNAIDITPNQKRAFISN